MSWFLNAFSKCFEMFQNVSPIKNLNCSKIAVDFSILISTILNPLKMWIPSQFEINFQSNNTFGFPNMHCLHKLNCHVEFCFNLNNVHLTLSQTFFHANLVLFTFFPYPFFLIFFFFFSVASFSSCVLFFSCASTCLFLWLICQICSRLFSFPCIQSRWQHHIFLLDSCYRTMLPFLNLFWSHNTMAHVFCYQLSNPICHHFDSLFFFHCILPGICS